MIPGGIGFQELIVIGVVAVLLFGSRLPEVARSLGNTYQQFRKGLAEFQSTIKTDSDNDYSTSYNRGLPDYSDANDDYEEPLAPKFEPPTESDS